MTIMSGIKPRDFGTTSVSRAETSHTTAVVRALDGRDATLLCDGEEIGGKVAFSCLVRPEPDDRVLIARDSDTAWVLSILDRPSAAPMCLFAEGDVSLVSARGNVSLLAAGGVSIDAGEHARMAGREITLHAGVARFVLDELIQVGRRANLYIAKIRSVGEMVETFADHVLTRAKRATRFIEESDQLRAGDIDHRAESTMQFRAKTTFITADTVVRVDAEQIHMG